MKNLGLKKENESPLLFMVLNLDGYSEIDTHVRSNLLYLICLRHLIRSRCSGWSHSSRQFWIPGGPWEPHYFRSRLDRGHPLKHGSNVIYPFLINSFWLTWIVHPVYAAYYILGASEITANLYCNCVCFGKFAWFSV